MTDADALGRGFYVATLWASAGGASGAAVRSYLKATYGEASLINVGRAAERVNYGALEQEFRRAIDDGASADQPTTADLFSGLLKVGGQTPSVLTTVATVVKEDAQAVASFSLTGLKVLAVVAIVGGIAYILFTTGAGRAIAKRARG